MKKLCIFAIILILFISPVFARATPVTYFCEIDKSGIPEETVFVDMLIPISESDSEYVSFNEENGNKNGISEESEIVLYNEGGFSSYTFHRASARSKIKLISRNEGVFVQFLTDDEGVDYVGFSSMDEFGKIYKTAKFAYIDKDGNILSLTNETDIWNGNGYTDILISISDEEAFSDMKDNTPYIAILIVVFIVFSLFASVITGIIFFIIYLIKRKKKK